MGLIDDDARADPRGVGELIEAALVEQEGGEEPITGALMALQVRGSLEVLEAARQLACSSDPRRRSLACYILRELGSPERTFPEECCDTLLKMLASEQNADVLREVVYGFGFIGNRRADPQLIALTKHRDDDIRRGAAFSLDGATSPEAIGALLDLMRDRDDVTRDWATAGVAAHAPLDDPHVHEALWLASTDPSRFVRGEAMYGLARRGDRRIVRRLIHELSEDEARNSSTFHEAGLAMLGWEDATVEEMISELRRSIIAH